MNMRVCIRSRDIVVVVLAFIINQACVEYLDLNVWVDQIAIMLMKYL
jgi:hypothetical protein